jgi:DNA-damage-inducible protein D
VRNANRKLNSAAKQAGVQKFAIFHDAGYRGLYGMGLARIKNKKRIPPKEDLLDCAGRTELAANEFRITQTEDKLLRDQINSERDAINTHEKVGQEVRATINKLGGTMPENLPSEPPIRKLVSQRKKQVSTPDKQE